MGLWRLTAHGPAGPRCRPVIAGDRWAREPASPIPRTGRECRCRRRGSHPRGVVPLRHGAAAAPPYLVTLNDADPFGGAPDVDRLARITPEGEPIGIRTANM